jgi:branched-chain amino acid transport system ATP-binding protein
MLNIRQIEAGYGKKQILFDISLQVQAKEIVAIIGPNGCGKSTILKTICGLTHPWSGEILFDGVNINDKTPSQTMARKLVFAPQGNRVFDRLTVLENLKLGGQHLSSSQIQVRIDEVIVLFPVLQENRHQEAGKLSGGQQQMLALARTLISAPKLLMLDEPSLGLSPKLFRDVFDTIIRINQETGVAILIVEQRVREVLGICDRVYGIKRGQNFLEENPNDLLNNPQNLKQLFL